MSSSAATVPGESVRPDEFDNPFRAELFGSDHLDELARTLAGRWPVGVQIGSRPLLRRLRDNERVLRRAREEAAAAAARNEPLTPDAEWLLDNFFVIEDVLREVRTDLPSGYYDELPVVTDGPWTGYPRVYALAVTLITHTDSHLEDGQVLRFAKAFQAVAPLTTGELWAIPTTLRLALLENLRRLAGQMLAVRVERDRGLAWVRQAAAAPNAPPPLPDAPADAFLVGMHQGLRDLGDSPPEAISDWLARYAGDLTEVLRREHRRQAANQVSVGNCVTSLRLLHAIDWAEFFERASPVEGVLRAEPTGVYRRQEFATRDRYRQAVEQMARAAGRDELEVARLAVARAAAATDPRRQHVGYHLVAEGRRPFARELGCRFKFRDRWRTFLTDHPYIVYFGGLAAVTGGLVAPAVGLAAAAGAAPWLLALVALAALLPASDIAVSLVNYAVCRLLPPRVLPKMDFTTGIPSDCRTVVVIPGMLTRPESATALCERLELHYLANPDPQLRFALLTDWADAPTETTPGSAAGQNGRRPLLLPAAATSTVPLCLRYRSQNISKPSSGRSLRLVPPADRLMMSGPRPRAASRCLTISVSSVAPARLSTLATCTAASGAKQRATPAMNVPCPA